MKHNYKQMVMGEIEAGDQKLNRKTITVTETRKKTELPKL